MKKERAQNLKQGEEVFYAGKSYEVAEIKNFPHGIMIGIYDDPSNKHIDYLNPSSVDEVNPFNEGVRKKANEDVKLYIAAGWSIKKETKESYILVRNNATFVGHLLVLVILGWYTLLIPNILYHIFSKEKKEILF